LQTLCNSSWIEALPAVPLRVQLEGGALVVRVRHVFLLTNAKFTTRFRCVYALNDHLRIVITHAAKCYRNAGAARAPFIAR
jgi:hypothetical protein